MCSIISFFESSTSRSRVVEDLSEHSIIEEEQKEKVLSVLLYRHKHVHPHNNTFKFGLKRSMSQRSIQVRGLYQAPGPMQEEGGMVLKRVSTIIPLGNLTRRSTAKEFESKRRKLSEPGPMKNRNSWIGNTEVDGLDECKVLAQGSRMEYSMFTVIYMSFIFWGDRCV